MPSPGPLRSTGQGQHRGSVVLSTDMDRGEAERRRVPLLVERSGGLFRVGRQTERRDQPGQCLVIDLVPDAERIDMAGRDAEQAGDMRACRSSGSAFGRPIRGAGASEIRPRAAATPELPETIPAPNGRGSCRRITPPPLPASPLRPSASGPASVGCNRRHCRRKESWRGKRRRAHLRRGRRAVDEQREGMRAQQIGFARFPDPPGLGAAGRLGGIDQRLPDERRRQFREMEIEIAVIGVHHHQKAFVDVALSARRIEFAGGAAQHIAERLARPGCPNPRRSPRPRPA